MNYYKTLEISPEATSDEIKKAYQTLILKNHPDKFPPQKREIYNKLSEKKRKGDLLSESELKESQDLIMPFLKIQKAYKLLSDPEKRRRYDESGYQENTVKLDDLFEDYIRKEPYDFLYQSIAADDLESVRKVVEKFDININAKYDYVYIDTTPIDYAIKEDHDKIVDYLISKGAEICLTDSLRLAIKLNSYKTAKLLLNKCDVNSINIQDNNGNTVLHDFFKYFNKPNYDGFILKSFSSDSYSFFNFSQPTSKDSSRSDVKENAQSSAVICNTSHFERSMRRSLDQIKSQLDLMEFREGRARDGIIITLENAIALVHSFIDKGVCYDIQNNEYETSLDMCIDQFIRNHRAKILNKEEKDGILGFLYYDHVEKEKAYYLIINIFVEKGITGLKYKDEVPISHKIMEYNIYPHIENKAKVDLLEMDRFNNMANGKSPADLLIERSKSVKGGYFSAKKKSDALKKGLKTLGVTQEETAEKSSLNGQAAYFTIAIALSALIIATAFLTQTYIILAALVIPAILGLYGWLLCKEDQNIKPDSKLQEELKVTKSTISDIETGA